MRGLHRIWCKEADINEDICFYDMYHAYATLTIPNGVNAKTVSGIRGHYSSSFTLDTYT